jgi:hypothetical protein
LKNSHLSIKINQQWNQLRQRAKARLEMIDELHSVVATLSRVVYEISHPEGLQMDEDESTPP